MRAIASITLTLLATQGAALALPIYATNNQNQLLVFDTGTPGTISSAVAITGLQNGENILGIDFRPATGQLIALGSTSRLYSLSLVSGIATQIGMAGAFTLTGTAFGFDFNPVPDRIRVVSDTGQNLRLNPNDGTLTATDGALNPGMPNVTAAGYTNSFAGTATTTLYVIDSNTDQLLIQNPPNNGSLTAVGALGINVTNINGFDIAFPGNAAYGAFQVGSGTSGLYAVDLTTGAATLIGGIGSGQVITGLAVSAVPEPGTWMLMSAALAVGLMFKRRR